MGPVYLVIFCYWVGPVPYLELFGAGPVEKNTLYYLIAVLCGHNPNFLILDEPTNHLDIETIEALGHALIKYVSSEK